MKEAILPTQPLEMDLDTLRYWQSEVKASLQRQAREYSERINYNELVTYLEGLQYDSTLGKLAVVDEFSPAILSVVSSVYYQNPTVQVDAASPQAETDVKPQLMFLLAHPDWQPFSLIDLMRGSIVYAMETGGMKEAMQTTCFDLLLAGYGVVEANHTTTSDEPPAKDPSDSDKGTMLDTMIGTVKSLFGGAKPQQEVAEDVARDTATDLRTNTSNRTYVKRWNPNDILFDPRAQVFDESRWVGKIVRLSLAEFNAKYPKFKGKVGLGDADLQVMQYATYNRDENNKSVIIYELEIKKRGPRNCVLVLHPSMTQALDYYERPIITNKFALKYGCIDKYGRIYPMSRGKKAKKPQDDINHYMTVQFEHVDRAQRKIAYYNEGLTESGKAAQRSADVYALVEKKIPNAVYEAMPAPQVVPENKEIVVKMTDSLNKAIGTTELAKSGESQNDTLGQDELQQTAFMSNVNAIQDALQDLADQVVDALKDIIQQLWDDTDYFKVTGIKGGSAWYDPAMGPLADLLLGDYKVRVNVASAMRPNPAKDRNDSMELAAFVTSPPMVQYAAMHGKRPSMEPLNNVVKQFNMNPEMVFEDLQPLQPPMVAPPTPSNANLVKAEDSRFQTAADQLSEAPEGEPNAAL